MVKNIVVKYLKEKLTASSMDSQSSIEEAIYIRILGRLPINHPSLSIASAAGELYSILLDVGIVELLVVKHLIKRLRPLANIPSKVVYTEVCNLVVNKLPPGCLSEDVAEAASKLYSLLLDADKEDRKVRKHIQYLEYKAKKKLKEDK